MVARLLLLAALLAPQPPPRPPKPPKVHAPTVDVIVSPRTGFAPITVTAEGLIHDPDHLLLCPSFFFFWGDGSKSVDETLTCTVLSKDERPSLRRTNPQHHRYNSLGYAGEIVIVVVDAANPDRRALGRRYVEFRGRFARINQIFAAAR